MKIIFMGTPHFAAEILQTLYQAGHDICCVYTNPPARSGRGKSLKHSSVYDIANKLSLPTLMPQNFKNQTECQSFAEHQADLAIVVAYGKILPQEILDIPKQGCWNIHASLLPRWRGAAPIQRALMAGDCQTGISIMKMEAGLDTGDVLYKKEIAILSDDTTDSLHDKLMKTGQECILKMLKQEQEFIATPQDKDLVTYAKKIDKAESKIDWQADAIDLDYHIRGLSSFPGAWFEWETQRIKVLFAKAIETTTQLEAGTIIQAEKNTLIIACKKGALQIIRLQKSGKPAVDISEFLNGHKMKQGSKLK